MKCKWKWTIGNNERRNINISYKITCGLIPRAVRCTHLTLVFNGIETATCKYKMICIKWSTISDLLQSRTVCVRVCVAHKWKILENIESPRSIFSELKISHNQPKYSVFHASTTSGNLICWPRCEIITARRIRMWAIRTFLDTLVSKSNNVQFNDAFDHWFSLQFWFCQSHNLDFTAD